MLITKSLAFGMVLGTRGQHLPINGIDYDVDKLADFVAGGNNQGISLGCLIFPLYHNRYFLVVPTRMGGELSSKFLFLIPFLVSLPLWFSLPFSANQRHTLPYTRLRTTLLDH